MGKRRDYEELEDLELSPELARQVENAVAQAERDVDARKRGHQDVRVNFRWSSRPLQCVMDAADLMGVPYQTYIKEAAMRQALADLKSAREVQGPAFGDDRSSPRGLQLVKSGG